MGWFKRSGQCQTNLLDCLTVNRSSLLASQRISVRVPGKIVQRLKERSRVTGKHESEVVRHALEEYFSRTTSEKTAYDDFLEAGLIGSAPELPEDIATNKRHFKGFGKTK
jgi:predicted transcriptional regulator